MLCGLCSLHPVLAAPSGFVEFWRMERAQSDLLLSPGVDSSRAQQPCHPSLKMGSKRLKRRDSSLHSVHPDSKAHCTW